MKTDFTSDTVDGSVKSDPQGGIELLRMDPVEFKTHFGQRGFLIQHELATHPLLGLPELVSLAKRLPPHDVSYNSGDISVSQGLYQGPQTGLSVEETIRRIEECNSWMVLKRVEQDAAYRNLLDQCLDQVRDLSEPLDPGMCQREGFIFISSPSAVTPYHMDPEFNFLLQIRGSKKIHMFDGMDRSILSETEVEEFMASNGEKNLSFKDEYEGRSSVFDLSPGVGLHFPATAPHWVENGNQVSISFSITFRTLSVERRAIIYNINKKLRSKGISPTPFGCSRLRDSTKYQAYRVLNRLKNLTGFIRE
jgi:hypothetical protein